jgi:LysR family glycine cleavage system transcriptional activator
MSERLLPLRALLAFEAVARHRSFARAAAELHVTPGAVSQQIKLLEEHLGIALFERGRQLRLTTAAAAVVRPLHSALETLRVVSRQLRSHAGERVLVVSVAPSFASRWLIPRLERFNQRCPDVELRLLATRRTVDFATENVDVAVRYGAGHYPGLHVERLRCETVVAVAHPRLAATIREPADLAAATLLHNAGMSWDPTFPDWPAWLAASGVVPRRALRLREFEEANFLIEAALAGLGVALAWKTLVAVDLAAGRLVALFEERPLSNAYHFVCPPEYLPRPDVAAFRQWLADETKVDLDDGLAPSQGPRPAHPAARQAGRAGRRARAGNRGY